jgi:hypothetical protein
MKPMVGVRAYDGAFGRVATSIYDSHLRSFGIDMFGFKGLQIRTRLEKTRVDILRTLKSILVDYPAVR